MSAGILGAGFKPDEVEGSNDFDAIPAGEYRAVVAETEEKKTKNGLGEYLQIKFAVTGGECDGRNLWARLNLVNQNATTVQIAKRDLKALCQAVGLSVLTDPAQLHDHVVLLKVIQKPDDNGELRNEIKGYKPVTGSVPSAGKPATSVTGSTAPWKNKK